MPLPNSNVSGQYSDTACSARCTEYGTHTCCPPLIVLAMRSERSESEAALDRVRYRGEQSSEQLSQFSGALVSAEYCHCTFTMANASQSGNSSL